MTSRWRANACARCLPRNRGYRWWPAGDGRETVALVERERPDVAIVDISMPVMNGIEATKGIKKVAPETAVLVLTAYDDDQYVFAILEAGAAGFLLKNARGSELIDAVRRVHAGE